MSGRCQRRGGALAIQVRVTRALLLAAALGLAIGCTDAERQSASTSTTTPRPPGFVSTSVAPSTGPVLPPDAPRHDGTHLPVAELATLLGCPEAPVAPKEVVPTVPGEPLPAETRDCDTTAGFAQIREYTNQVDLDDAIAANEDYCATVVIGDRWTAAGNTPAVAAHIQGILGGRIVTFAGCAPGAEH